jgi:hypothetical protein
MLREVADDVRKGHGTHAYVAVTQLPHRVFTPRVHVPARVHKKAAVAASVNRAAAVLNGRGRVVRTCRICSVVGRGFRSRQWPLMQEPRHWTGKCTADAVADAQLPKQVVPEREGGAIVCASVADTSVEVSWSNTSA